MFSVEATEKAVSSYPVNGYAPGHYSCYCHHCQCEFTGDKRALTCETCALDDLVTAAKLFARDRHHGQEYGGQPYVESHVAKVVSILKELGFDGFYQAAGWLHDVIEDTETTREEVEQKFGKRVASLVWACTGIGSNRRARNASIYEKIATYPDASVVKVADRIANVAASAASSRHRQMYLNERATFHELVAHYAPKKLVDALERAYDS